jgi:aspartate carbamoyltransferase
MGLATATIPEQLEQSNVLALPDSASDRDERLAVLEGQLPAINGDFVGKSVVAMSQLERLDIELLYAEAEKVFADEAAGLATDNLHGMRVGVEFFEDSLRTRYSNEFAAGGDGAFVSGFNSRAGLSSNKGETDEDTLQNMDQYVRLHILRHPSAEFVLERALDLEHPLHNGGNGTWEHPTQALLDGFTLKKLLGDVGGNRYTVYGDLLNGRTVHSLAELLAKQGAEAINCVAPEQLQLPEHVQRKVGEYGTKLTLTDDINEVIRQTDALYRVRTQANRYNKEEFEAIKNAAPVPMVTLDLLNKAPNGVVFLHPGPEDQHNPDYVPELRQDPRYNVLFQARMGLVVRRALMRLTLNRADTTG